MYVLNTNQPGLALMQYIHTKSKLHVRMGNTASIPLNHQTVVNTKYMSYRKVQHGFKNKVFTMGWRQHTNRFI